MANILSPLSDADGDLADMLGICLSRDLAEPVSIASLQREPSQFATLFPAEEVKVTLDNGTIIRLFLKHLGDEQADHPDKQRRDREGLVYERLFTQQDLPVPKYYGSYENTPTRRTGLLLEFVDDWNLKYHELSQWYAAANGLAKLHAYFAARPKLLEKSDFLLRFDEAYFLDWACRGVEAVAMVSGKLGDRLSRLLTGYGRVAELLARQPITLVHNDLAPKNVISDRSTTPPRICIVDWEMAGAGCGVLDLSHLKYGLEPLADRAMVSAYRQAASEAETPFIPSDDTSFERLLIACDLHKTLYRLAHVGHWKFSVERVEPWIADAEAQLAFVLDRREVAP